MKLDFDIVFVQETHLTIFNFAEIQRTLSPHWKCYWGFTDRPQSAGVGILIQNKLISSGFFSILENEKLGAQLCVSRILSLSVKFHDQFFFLTSLYFPNDFAAQRQFITQLSTLHTQQQRLRATAVPIWAGDFNFVHQVTLDRWRGASAGGDNASDEYLVAFPFLSDVFRSLHPTRKVFSFHHVNGLSASRLDRFYVPTSALPLCSNCSVHTQNYRSDHRPVSLLLHVQPSFPPPKNRAPPRLRLDFIFDRTFRRNFEVWLEQFIASAPADDAQFLVWWSHFKRQLAMEIRSTSRSFSQHQLSIDDIQKQIDDLYSRIDAEDPTVSFASLYSLQKQRSESLAQNFKLNQARSRFNLVQSREQPTKALTAKLSTPKARSLIPPFRKPNGSFSPSPDAQAHMAGEYWAQISSPPTISIVDQDLLLDSLSPADIFTQEEQDALGLSTIDLDEVKRTFRHIRSGTSPGLDGIPVEFYRRFKSFMYPLLVRLFSIICSQTTLPPQFSVGLMVLIPKTHPSSSLVADYRPITLLNSDYRIFSKLLANRLRSPLNRILPEVQTAFLPSRQIGDTILNLQFMTPLASVFKIPQIYGLFCDFQKAYDTVDRSFLFRILDRMHVGDKFLSFIRLLLTNTFSHTKVNGALSRRFSFLAGVRQGCPISPLLYLFISHAIYRFLSSRGHGLHLQLATPTPTLFDNFGGQYADDLTPLFTSLTEVPKLVDSFQIIARGSNQRLNPKKSSVCLLAGSETDIILPEEIEGIPVVRSTKTLGIYFGVDAHTHDHSAWADQFSVLSSKLAKIHSLKLSIFGRAFAASAYGLSRFLYHMEFSYSETYMLFEERAMKAVHKLVSQNMPPSSTEQKFYRYARAPTLGPPSGGGLGVLPLPQHRLSRAAKWAARALGPRAHAWCRVLEVLCLQLSSGRFGRLAANAWPSSLLPLSDVPAPLGRMIEGFSSLPSPELKLAPGAWCFFAPLWGNPYFRTESLSFDLIDVGQMLFTQLGRFCDTLGRLCICCSLLSVPSLPVCTRFDFDLTLFFDYDIWNVLDTFVLSLGDRVSGLEVAQKYLHFVWSSLPRPYTHATQSSFEKFLLLHVMPTGSRSATEQMLISHSFYPLPKNKSLPITSLSVKVATRMQLVSHSVDVQRPYWSSFLSLALNSPPMESHFSELACLFSRFWSLKLDNHVKEIFWHLVYNAVPLASRLHKPDDTCCCGHVCPDRVHVFWDCPVLDPLKADLRAQLPRFELSRTSLWLARPPSYVRPLIWRVVCLAFLQAADSARASIFAQRKKGLPDARVLVHTPLTARFKFWGSLSDFVNLSLLPPEFVRKLPVSHPFIARTPQGDLRVVSPHQ